MHACTNLGHLMYFLHDVIFVQAYVNYKPGFSLYFQILLNLYFQIVYIKVGV